MAASYDGSIIINTKVDPSGAEKGLKTVESRVGKLGGVIKKLGAAIAAAFAVRQIVAFSKECIELGSDLEEVQNVVDVTFGQMSSVIDDFARNAATQFGLSELAAKQYTSTIGAMLKSMGLSGETVTDMSIKIAELAGDMASFYNLDPDEAFAKIRSGISGETEPLKQLGINLSEANLEQYRLAQGISTAYRAMSQQEKALLRYNYLLSVTSDAQGDFARTSNSWANQTRILNLQLQQIKANLGQGLINLLLPGLKLLNKVLSAIVRVAEAFKALTELLTGKKSSDAQVSESTVAADTMDDLAIGLDDAASAADGYADSMQDVAAQTQAARREAEKYLSPLDHINRYQTEKEADTVTMPTVTTPSTGAAGTSGLVEAAAQAAQNLGKTDFGKLEEGETIIDKLSLKIGSLIDWLGKLGDAFMKGFDFGLGGGGLDLSPLKISLDEIAVSLQTIFNSADVREAVNNYINTLVYALGQRAGALTSIGASLASALLGGIAQYLEDNTDRIIGYLVRMFDIWSEVETIKGNFASALAYILSAFGSPEAQSAVASLLTIITDVFMMISDVCTSFGRDVLNLITQPFIDNQEALRKALNGMLSVVAGVLTMLRGLVSRTVNSIIKLYDEHIKPFIDAIADGVSQLVGTVVDFYNAHLQPVLDRLIAKINDLSEKYITPFIDMVLGLVGDVFDLLTVLWNNILVPLFDWFIGTVAPVLGPIIEGLGTIATGAIKGVIAIITIFLQVLRWVIQFITLIFSTDWAKVWEDIQVAAVDAWVAIKSKAIEYWSKIKREISDRWDSIKKSVKDAVELVRATLAAQWGGMLDKVQSVWEDIVDAITGKWEEIRTAVTDAVTLVRGILTVQWDLIKKGVESVWKAITTKVSNAWESIQTTVTDAVKLVKGILTVNWDLIRGGAERVWNGIHDFISGIWDKINSGAGTSLGTIRDTILGVFRNVKDKCSLIFTAISNIIINAFELASKLIKTPFNVIIWIVNQLIGCLNSLFNSITELLTFTIQIEKPGFLGGGYLIDWSVPGPRFPTINEIPYLASGAVIPPNAPFMAVLGDQPSGKNIEAPERLLRQVVREESGGATILKVYLDGKIVYESVIKEGRQRQQMSGENPFELAY